MLVPPSFYLKFMFGYNGPRKFLTPAKSFTDFDRDGRDDLRISPIRSSTRGRMLHFGRMTHHREYGCHRGFDGDCSRSDTRTGSRRL